MSKPQRAKPSRARLGSARFHPYPGYPPPYGEWPGGRNHLQSLSWCVYLLCVELTCLAGLYHLSCILEGGWPVETMAEGLTDQCAG
jgi:hypothetical protein